MSGSRSGFAITLSARDSASATLDLINKRIASLQRQAQHFARESGRLGETAGVNRLGEGMKTLGGHTTDAWRSLDRMLPLLGALTGAASIAGMTALANKWSELGQSTANLSYRLATPVEKIGAMRGALMQVGGTAAEADAGLRGFQATLSAASWGRDQEAMQAFKDIFVDPGDARAGRVRQLGDVLGDVAEKLEGKTADAQARELQRLGLTGDAWLKALGNGRKAWEDLQARSAATGGTMTEQMTANADRMAKSWSILEQAIGGVRNRVIDEYAPAITKIMDQAELWIEHNKDIADSIAAIGTAAVATIGGLAALKPAAWILKLLGLGALGAAGAAVAGEEMLYEGTRVKPAGPTQEEENKQLGGSAAERFPNLVVPKSVPLGPVSPETRPFALPRVVPGAEARPGTPVPGTEARPGMPLATPAPSGPSWWQRNVPSWLGGADTSNAGPGTTLGGGAAARPGGGPAGTEARPGAAPTTATPGPQSMAAPTPFTVAGLTPRDGAAGANGHVQVDVHLKGPTRVDVMTQGPVRAPPPRIEMPLTAAA